jgi:hypothetical protein
VHRQISEFCSTFDNLHFLQMSSVLLEDNGSRRAVCVWRVPCYHTFALVSCRVVSCRVVSCRVVSCRVVSCRVVSCRVSV